MITTQKNKQFFLLDPVEMKAIKSCVKIVGKIRIKRRKLFTYC